MQSQSIKLAQRRSSLGESGYGYIARLKEFSFAYHFCATLGTSQVETTLADHVLDVVTTLRAYAVSPGSGSGLITASSTLAGSAAANALTLVTATAAAFTCTSSKE
jgi:hypothetical protein